MTFTELNLHPKILQAIGKLGYNQPTPIQAQAIPHILAGKDIVASAQTGTGKTAAYILPGVQLLLTKKSSGKPRILILAPTRELATQITKCIDEYKKITKINSVSFIGGMPYMRQLRELAKPIDIIIATPGRLMDHMQNKRLDLSHIEMLILDEADRMLDMGFIDDIKTIVQVTPSKRQTLLFSATADSKLLSIMKNLLRDPVRINISQEKIDTNLIKQKIHIVKDPSHKMQILEQLLSETNIFKAIIFSATKRNAAKLATKLAEHDYTALPMHGDLKQNARNRTLAQFHAGKIQFLVATDVAARGIDVTDISHVINYDLPRNTEDYVHRIGRTGRAGRTGTAISIALCSEVHQLKKIERYIGNTIQMVQMTLNGEQEWQYTADDSTTNAKRRRRKNKSHYSSPKRQYTKKFGKSKSNTHHSSHQRSHAKQTSNGHREEHTHKDSYHKKTKGGHGQHAAHKNPHTKKDEGGNRHDSAHKSPYAKKAGAAFGKRFGASSHGKKFGNKHRSYNK